MSQSTSSRITSTFSKIPRCIGFIFILLSSLFTGCSTDAGTLESAPGTIYEIPISIAYPNPLVELSLISEMPGMLRIIGYNGSDFVTGTVEVSNDIWAPHIERSDGKIALVQRPKTKVIDTQDLTNLWKLRVSDKTPFRFTIINKQAEGHWNFSGLPIIELYAEIGTAKNAFTFDEVNPAVMQKCELHCGTGDVFVEGLLNAVCQNMVILAGEGNLDLRFNGKELLQDMKVSIRAGTGILNIIIFKDIPARITVTSRGRVILGEGMIKPDDTNNNVFETISYWKKTGKIIDITVSGGPSNIYLNPSP